MIRVRCSACGGWLRKMSVFQHANPAPRARKRIDRCRTVFFGGEQRLDGEDREAAVLAKTAAHRVVPNAARRFPGVAAERLREEKEGVVGDAAVGVARQSSLHARSAGSGSAACP